MARKKSKEVKKPRPKFGTFGGAFVPSTLAILGAVMYYILPEVLGSVGLVRTILIILIANSVTLATAFSIAAITTNINVKGGGLYYLISRSLGSEFGGSIGIQLFLAQTVSVSLYTLAFTKAASAILLSFGLAVSELYLSLGFCLLFAALVFMGANFVIRIQYVVLVGILLSLVSLFMAPNMSMEPEFFEAPELAFWVAFVLFFPAVTGIGTGIGMSGDMKDPRKSIVRGTFAAILFTLAVYIAVAAKLFYAASPSQLVSDPFVFGTISYLPVLVLIGVLLASFSSAVSSFMAAPRALRAMVKDRIIPFKVLGAGMGKSAEPRVALVFSFLIAASVLFLESLEVISMVVAVFFLNVYGWINAAAFLERLSGNPSFRPTFNAPLPLSLYGMVVCYVIMFLFSPWLMFGGIAFQLALFFILRREGTSMKLEGVWEGLTFQVLRKALKSIEAMRKSHKNWQPRILAVSLSKKNALHLANLTSWLTTHRGLTELFVLLKGELDGKHRQKQDFETELKEFAKEHRVDLFPKALLVKKPYDAYKTILQSESLGNLPYNTVLIHYDDEFSLGKMVKYSKESGKNVLVLRGGRIVRHKRIDVWVKEDDNANFMLLLAYLIAQSPKWAGASIRLFRAVESQSVRLEAERELAELVAKARVENVLSQAVVKSKKGINDTIHTRSHTADLVILGTPLHGLKTANQDISDSIRTLSDKLKATLIVHAQESFDLKIN